MACSKNRVLSSREPDEVHPHWFFEKTEKNNRKVWRPFSLLDSVRLEAAFLNGDPPVVATCGTRYDVDVQEKVRKAVYWNEDPSPVRRSIWFYKTGSGQTWSPYDEPMQETLEREYRHAVERNLWPKKLDFGDGEMVVMHSSEVIAHFPPLSKATLAATVAEATPWTVRRGADDVDIDDGESDNIDHLIFFVHGIGPVCDFRMRDIVECVNDMREMGRQLLSTHFSNAAKEGKVGRIEMIPISWYSALHLGVDESDGADEKMKRITLPSVPLMRTMLNETLLDILYYTSPKYCQRIIDRVGSEMNRCYSLFLERHPDFTGSIAIAGHSLGSLISFDILNHQTPSEVSVREAVFLSCLRSHGMMGLREWLRERGISDTRSMVLIRDCDLSDFDDKTRQKLLDMASAQEGTAKEEYTSSGNIGTGAPNITYPALSFAPSIFFALGSPTSMFLMLRDMDHLGRDFRLPTCPSVFNVFHPFDPIAYRYETLLDPEMHGFSPVLIPHHKGRKRLHLELKETMSRVSTDLRNKVVDSLKNTWGTLYSLTGTSPPPQTATPLSPQRSTDSNVSSAEQATTSLEAGLDLEAVQKDDEIQRQQLLESGAMLRLNNGRRVDHVLQETPLESFNEYLFALSAHVCYWDSEDTLLFMMKEMYALNSIKPDSDSSRQPASTAGDAAEETPARDNAAGMMGNVELTPSATPTSVFDSGIS
ncbi:unnamed protein product [Cyprideis torosa]|uniref:Uncharacterized protein n=1 Tax=Cyprideis torosa TaxID=163714 RepID=A0A7R8ZKC0_9CRUS|nr:unnamed protein product [Cyprideis torosa]CAG0889001.1 unnamed protein product [Cyprideis torosa]